MNALWKKNQKLWLSTGILFAMITLGMTAIFRANINYGDDLHRVHLGIAGWTYFSRYTSEILSHLVHTSFRLNDISPLPQILAALILAFAGGILITVFSPEAVKGMPKRRYIVLLAAAVILALNPYMMQCLSYKYDAPYMALSVLAGIFPLLFLYEPKYKYAICVIICTIIMLTTYQASSGVFPLVVLTVMLTEWLKGKSFREVLVNALWSAVYFVIGGVIFRLFIMRRVPVGTAYASTDIFGIHDLIPGIYHNLKMYYETILTEYNRSWLLLMAAVTVLFVVRAILCNRHRKWISLLLVLAFLASGYGLVFGLYVMLEKPMFAPRSMYGVNIFVSILAVAGISLEPDHTGRAGRFISWPFYISTLILSWCFFVFPFNYGNALEEQKQYATARMQMVLDDLNSSGILSTQDEVNLQLDGDIGFCPILKNENNPLIYEMVPTMFSGNSGRWNQYQFFNYFNLGNVHQSTYYGNEAEDLRKKNLPVVEDTRYYTICQKDNEVLVTLKE